jgi:hypothetical protein
MLIATLILILSMALLFFYDQAACQKILRRRQFPQSFWQEIADANGLGFPAVRKSLEAGIPVEYPRLMMTLKSDFLALTYLLKTAGNVKQRCIHEEWLLVLYFKLVYISLVVRHWLRLPEKPAALELTAILQYLANVVGERVNTL